MIRRSFLVALTTCTIALAFGEQGAFAQHPIVFGINGGGVAPNGLPLPGEPSRPHSSVGTATYFGNYTGIGYVQTDSAQFFPNGLITGTFGSDGPYIFTATNGDNLACYYGRTDFGASKPGTFTLVPVTGLGPGWYVAFFVAEFVPYLPECTGQFVGVRGRWTMLAVTDPFVLGSDDPIDYEWAGRGTLLFTRGGGAGPQ
jgi:hypothetical protein